MCIFFYTNTFELSYGHAVDQFNQQSVITSCWCVLNVDNNYWYVSILAVLPAGGRRSCYFSSLGTNSTRRACSYVI
jgi:hypothetical protein